MNHGAETDDRAGAEAVAWGRLVAFQVVVLVLIVASFLGVIVTGAFGPLFAQRPP